MSFPSVAFSEGGGSLAYLANHKGGFAQLHTIDLYALNDGPTDLWKSEAGTVAHGLVLAPTGGHTLAFTTGAACDEDVALIGSGVDMAPALPSVDAPTRALGYIGRSRLLVAAGGCGKPVDLYAIEKGVPRLLVDGAALGASRFTGPEQAAPLPESIFGEVQEFG